MSRIMNDNIFLNFLLTLLIYIIPIFYIYSEEIKGIKDNTSSLETDIYYNHIEQTIERLKQLKQSVLFELHPSFTEPPSSNFDTLFLKNDTPVHTIVSKTSEPLLKEQLVASKEINIKPKFEEIFLLLSDEMRLRACKKLYADDMQNFVHNIILYLGRGTPEQAMTINQILPYLKDELEENLIALLQENPQDPIEKRTIIYALGRIKSEKSVPLLWNEIQTTQSEEIQYTCVQSLANMPHSLSLEQWGQLLQNNSVSV
ncbi:MAG: HEAT repeat domain-containing protein, partial [Candidatus Hydrogenedens sp.]